jgi:aminoglycoside phosphotransferase (APT) family kinase protein
VSKGSCTIVLLVPHPTRRALLASAPPEWSSDGIVRLPTATLERDFTSSACLMAVEALLGVQPRALRIDPRRRDIDLDPTLVVVDLEAFGPDAPSPYVWIDWATLPLDTLEPAELREALPRWIGRRELGPTAADPPWAIPGWFDRASGWMAERMAELRAPAFEAPRIVYLWGISIVLRAPSSLGPMFLKCSAPIFAQEARVTALLADATPDLVTRVAAIEPDEGWLLMRDHGERTLGDTAPEAWAPGLEAHARIQAAWAGREQALIDAGAPVRSLAALAEALPTFADREPMTAELTGDDRAAWNDSVPAFVAACERLDAIGPPPTLVHGDLHPWNVADTPDGPRVFDWTDAAISHPFVDLAVYATRPDDHAIRHALRDAYLAHWATQLSAADLTEAGELAIVVGTLYQVDSYIGLLSSLDPDDRGDLRGAAGSWARAAVATLADGIDLRRPGHADG